PELLHVLLDMPRCRADRHDAAAGGGERHPVLVEDGRLDRGRPAIDTHDQHGRPPPNWRSQPARPNEEHARCCARMLNPATLPACLTCYNMLLMSYLTRLQSTKFHNTAMPSGLAR